MQVIQYVYKGLSGHSKVVILALLLQHLDICASIKLLINLVYRLMVREVEVRGTLENRN